MAGYFVVFFGTVDFAAVDRARGVLVPLFDIDTAAIAAAAAAVAPTPNAIAVFGWLRAAVVTVSTTCESAS